MNRRNFLTALMASGVVAFAASTGLAWHVLETVKQRMHILYGDGAHDDTAALQALFDGETVEHNGRLIGYTYEGLIRVPEQGHYVIYDQITMPYDGINKYMRNSTIEAGKGFRGRYMIYAPRASNHGQVGDLSFFGTVAGRSNYPEFNNVSVS